MGSKKNWGKKRTQFFSMVLAGILTVNSSALLSIDSYAAELEKVPQNVTEVDEVEESSAVETTGNVQPEQTQGTEEASKQTQNKTEEEAEESKSGNEVETEAQTEIEMTNEMELENEMESETETVEEEKATRRTMTLRSQSENEKVYRLSELTQTATWGVTLDGSTDLALEKQYSAISYAIPEEIDKSRLEKIVCDVKDNSQYLSLKFFGDTNMQDELAVVYGASELSTGELNREAISCIGIMGLAEGASSFVVESVTFVLGEAKTEEVDEKADQVFTISDLEATASWNVEIEEKADGSADFVFTKQYGAISYRIPESVKAENIDKIVCKTTDSSHLSLKFLKEETMQEAELAVCYGNNTLSTSNITEGTPVCIAIMGLEEGYETTIESITFVMKTASTEIDTSIGDLTAACYKGANNNNPLITQRYTADPGVMVYKDTVYIYATNDVYEYKDGVITDNSYSKINNLNCISSTDLVNWTDHGTIEAAGSNGAATWAKNSWAPCATYKNINGKDKFFLYFADNGGGIGVLTADSPTGPWTDPLGHGLITRSTPNCSNVEWLFDPAVFVDDDGTGYLYFGGGVPAGKVADPGTARVVQLGDDMISLAGEPVQINPPYLFEDSGINKIGDKYYYSYCSNWNTDGSEFNNASIEYMVSDSPMGPFTFVGEMFKNPGTFLDGSWGNNHHTLFEFKGKYYLAYHARALEMAVFGENNGGYRSTQIDEVTVNGEKIEQVSATMTGVSQVKNVDPYETVRATTIARQKGIEVTGSGNPALTVTKGDWTLVKGVDFKNGLASLSMKVKADSTMTVEVRIGSNTGALLGTVKVQASDTYQDFSAAMKSTSGVKNLCFVFSGAAQVQSWKATGNVFTFDQLEEVTHYSLTKEITDEGALKLHYEKQYGEIQFKIPDSVDVSKVKAIVLNLSAGEADSLAVKALAEGVSDPLNVAYHQASVDTSSISAEDGLYSFGIMANNEGECDVTIESVLFEIEEASDDGQEVGIETDVPDLKDAMTKELGNDFIVGAAIMQSEITDANLMALVTKHFNAVTFGNELKPDAIFNYSNNTCPGTTKEVLNGEEIEVPVTNFDRAERMLNKIAEWNEEHPDSIIKVRGHVLTWHSQTPEWFFHEDYDASKPYADKDTMTKRHEWFIKTVLEHFVGEDSKYKDMFYGWDVVNEAVSDGRGTYRNDSENSSWWAVYQSNEFIINAFRFANKYAPAEVELYYNDYNETVTSKINGIAQLLTDVKNAEGTRIDGMGMQGHYSTAGSPTMEDFMSAAKTYADIVGKIQITELDFKASSAYDGTDATYDAENTRLAYRYKELYDAIKQLQQEGVQVTNMTVWGVIDKNSWLQSSSSVGGGADGRQKQIPLLFDDNYKVKPAFWALVNSEKLEPQIQSFDMLQCSDLSDETTCFANGNEITFSDGSVVATAIPVWSAEGIKVKASVQDSDEDTTDAVTVYLSDEGQIQKKTVTRSEGIATDNGYEVIVEVPCSAAALTVTNELRMDIVVTDGEQKLALNDYTMSQETKDDYYANIVLKPFMEIAKGTITVDGTIEDEWNKAGKIPMTINLGTNASADAKILWDEENLYVYMSVIDPVLNADSTAAHEQDSVEVFIDENNNKSSKYEEDDKQYRINYLNEHSFNGTKCLEENVKSHVTRTEHGYDVELAFAWTDVTPANGDKIGIELQINDADSTGKRIGTLSWYDTTGSGWEKPGVFGTAKLVDAENSDSENQEPNPQPAPQPNAPAQSDSTQESSTSSAAVRTSIDESNVPLADSVTEAAGLSLVDMELDEELRMKEELLMKYRGRNVYLMANIGKGIGFTVHSDQEVDSNVKLETAISDVVDFAEGFDTMQLKPVQERALNFELGMHVNLGAQYQGKIAYIFKKSLLTNQYELVTATEVNSIGNVAILTRELTDVMILIAK